LDGQYVHGLLNNPELATGSIYSRNWSKTSTELQYSNAATTAGQLVWPQFLLNAKFTSTVNIQLRSKTLPKTDLQLPSSPSKFFCSYIIGNGIDCSENCWLVSLYPCNVSFQPREKTFVNNLDLAYFRKDRIILSLHGAMNACSSGEVVYELPSRDHHNRYAYNDIPLISNNYYYRRQNHKCKISKFTPVFQPIASKLCLILFLQISCPPRLGTFPEICRNFERMETELLFTIVTHTFPSISETILIFRSSPKLRYGSRTAQLDGTKAKKGFSINPLCLVGGSVFRATPYSKGCLS
jgi:hypothetical protein